MNEAERLESAKAREQAAREQGDLKVFLSYDEAALMYASLTWVRADLAEANHALKSTTLPQTKEGIPADTFTMMDDVIDATKEGLLVQTTSDVVEQNVSNGNERLREHFDRMSSVLRRLQMIRYQVLQASFVQEALKRAKE